MFKLIESDDREQATAFPEIGRKVTAHAVSGLLSPDAHLREMPFIWLSLNFSYPLIGYVVHSVSVHRKSD